MKTSDPDRRLNTPQVVANFGLLITSLLASLFQFDVPLALSLFAVYVTLIAFFDEGSLSKAQRTLDQLEKTYGITSLSSLTKVVHALREKFEEVTEDGDIKKVLLVCGSPAIGAFAGHVGYNKMRAQMVDAAKVLKTNFKIVCYEMEDGDDVDSFGGSLGIFAKELGYPEGNIEAFIDEAKGLLRHLPKASVERRTFSHEIAKNTFSHEKLQHSVWYFHLCLFVYETGHKEIVMWHIERPKSSDTTENAQTKKAFVCSGFWTSQAELIDTLLDRIQERLND